MSDLEERLARSLAEHAEAAPSVAGLADGARGRLRTRRRRRVALGAAAAVVALAVPVAVLVDGRADQRATDPAWTVDAGPGWRTVAVEMDDLRRVGATATVLVDVPTAWVELDEEGLCASYDYGVPSDPCAEVEMVSVVGSASQDYTLGAGLRPREDYPYRIDAGWLGHVSLGVADVVVVSDDREVAQRVLGSARLEGQEIPDLDVEWPLVIDDRVAYRAPRWASPYGVRVTGRGTEEEYAEGTELAPGVWTASATVGERRIEVVAPTRALAELVAGSAYVGRKEPPPAGEPGWRTVTLGDAVVDLPAGWTSPPGCTGPGPAPTWGPAESDLPCREVPGVFRYATALFDPAYGPGVQRCESSGYCAYRSVGGTTLFFRGVPRDVAERMHDSVRPAG